MKQIAKSEDILAKLRTAYGPDAKLDGLAVYECVALTTLPLRKSGGIFQSARVSLSMLSEMAAAVNAESVPLQLVHDSEVIPFGRFFYGEVVNDELRGLFAVDGVNHPDIVTKLDNGTLDQVSVGFTMKRLTCSACGFDFLDPTHLVNLYTLTCDEDHTVGQDGVYVHVDGLKQFLELSLVGKGASQGARIVGPSDSQLQHNEQFRLAANADPGLLAVRLSPTIEEKREMNPEQMATFQAAVAGEATAKAQLAAAQDQVTTLTAQVSTLTAQVAELTATSADAAKHQTDAAAALEALTKEAKTVLTACGKADAAIPTEIPTILALIEEHRAQFAGIVPVGGKSKDASHQAPAFTPSNAAFRAPR